MAIGTNPGGGTLSGTSPVAAVAGVATFTNLSIDKAGTGYTLTASVGRPHERDQQRLQHHAPAPRRKLAFTVQPTQRRRRRRHRAGDPGDGAGRERQHGHDRYQLDHDGDRHEPGRRHALRHEPGRGGDRRGDLLDLSINKVGTGYTLTASAAGLTGATSTRVQHHGGRRDQARLHRAADATRWRARRIAPAIQVTVQDALGNTVTSATDSITLAIGTNPGGGTLSGTNPVAAVGRHRDVQQHLASTRPATATR